MTSLKKEEVTRLKSIADAQSVISAGSIRLIGLSELRDSFGSEWEEVKSSVLRYAHRTIQDFLSDTDVCVQASDGVFLIVFAEPDQSIADEKANSAAEAIRSKLFGNEGKMSATISTAVRMFRLDESSLAGFLAGNGETPPANKRVDENLQKACKNNRAKKEKPIGQTRFFPVWDVRQNAVFEFTARPKRNSDSRFPDRDLLGTADTAIERQAAAETDQQTITATGAEMRRLDKMGKRPVISMCVSASTFSSASLASSLMTEIANLPAQFKPYTQFIICEARIGAKAKDVELALIALRSSCRAVALATSIEETNFTWARQVGFDIIGFDIAPLKRSSESVIMAQSKRFLGGASEAGLRVFMHGAKTPSVCSFAACNGVEWLSGPAIGSPKKKVSAATKYEPQYLYHRSL